MPEATPETIVYFENQFVPFREAKISVLTHGFNYGTGVFEGIRGYWNDDDQELYLFRVEDHYRRWKTNCRILAMEPEMPAADLAAITAELVRRNGYQEDVYVRPIAYTSSPRIGVKPDGKYDFTIVAVPFGVYLPSENGVHACVASWRRVEDNAIPARAKICGAYVNSVLATMEAKANGFDEAIFLNEAGHVVEGATCNLFLMRDGKLITPPPSDNILEGLTRASVMELARREMGLTVEERSIDRSELYIADEVFLTGTAVELAPIIKIDHRQIGDGKVGRTTRELRALYAAAGRGRQPKYHHWLAGVYQPALSWAV